MFMQDVKSVMVFPLFFAICHLASYAVWVAVALYVGSMYVKEKGSTPEEHKACLVDQDPFCLEIDGTTGWVASLFLVLMLLWYNAFVQALSLFATSHAVG